MKRFKNLVWLASAGLSVLWGGSPTAAENGREPVTSISEPALYPETLEADQHRNGFLVGSMRQGAVYAVSRAGTARKLIDDPRLISVLGIAIDRASHRLLVTNSDLGVSVKQSALGPKRHAAIASYDLETGRVLQHVDLSALSGGGDHLINGITVDAKGNAYATDSFSPVIYRVTPEGRASIFLRDAEFEGEGVNLNGIVYHPAGFLLVVKKSTGALYRIPLADPAGWTRVRTPQDFVAGDGLLLRGNDLWLIANKTPKHAANAAFQLHSDDDWRSASVRRTQPLADSYPTTCAALGGEVYVLSSHLDEWLTSTEASRPELLGRARRAEIRALGKIGARSP